MPDHDTKSDNRTSALEALLATPEFEQGFRDAAAASDRARKARRLLERTRETQKKHQGAVEAPVADSTA